MTDYPSLDKKKVILFIILTISFFLFFKWSSVTDISDTSSLIAALTVAFIISEFLLHWKTIFIKNHDDEFV